MLIVQLPISLKDRVIMPEIHARGRIPGMKVKDFCLKKALFLVQIHTTKSEKEKYSVQFNFIFIEF